MTRNWYLLPGIATTREVRSAPAVGLMTETSIPHVGAVGPTLSRASFGDTLIFVALGFVRFAASCVLFEGPTTVT
jgi:hypothetical protein